jgi:SET domain-containing protein
MPTSKSRKKSLKKSAAKTSSRTARNKKGPAKKKAKRREPGLKRIETSPLVEARGSEIHGMGVYAVAPIKKGTRVLEYIGERISHAEADRRYEQKGADDGHTFLFIASSRTVIDATGGGNVARYINHSCNPNCETVIEQSRVFVEAIRNIKPGEELGYDYQLTWYSTDAPEDLALYACRCGAAKCRGTMLDREPLDKQAEKKKKAAKKKSARKSKRKASRKK